MLIGTLMMKYHDCKLYCSVALEDFITHTIYYWILLTDDKFTTHAFAQILLHCKLTLFLISTIFSGVLFSHICVVLSPEIWNNKATLLYIFWHSCLCYKNKWHRYSQSLYASNLIYHFEDFVMHTFASGREMHLGDWFMF